MGILLSDFPCLYYASTHFDRKTQCYLFSMLAAMTDNTPEQTVEKSDLFTHTTNLFNRQKFSLAEVEENSVCFEKPYKNCRGFFRRKVYNNSSMQKESCVICPYSPNYANHHIDDERDMLRCLIHNPASAGVICADRKDFASMLPISCSNDVSILPVIPFHAYIYDFIMEHDIENPSMLVDFIQKKQEKQEAKELKDENALLSFVKVQLGIIERRPETNPENLFLVVNRIRQFEYVPPQFVGPASGEKKERNKKLTESILSQMASLDALLQVSSEMKFEKPEAVIPLSVPEEPEREESWFDLYFDSDENEPAPAVPNDTTDMASSDFSEDAVHIADDKTVDEKTENEGIAESGVDINNLTAATESDDDNEEIAVSSSVSEAFAEEVAERAADTEAKSTDISEESEVIDEPEMNADASEPKPELCQDELGLCYPSVWEIKDDDFCRAIRNCSGSDIKALINFVQSTSHPGDVSVEYVRYQNTEGLLFYVEESFYFVVVAPDTVKLLKPIFSGARKLTFFSVCPVPVRAALFQIGVACAKIESVSVHYSVSKGFSYALPYEKLFEVSEKPDILRYGMPRYRELFQASALSSDAEKDRYRQLCHFENALANSCDTSFILLGSNSVLATCALDYRFTFSGCDNFCREGVLYLLTLDESCRVEREQERKLWEDVAGRLAASSNPSMRYSFLLSLGTGIGYFSCFDWDIFYDALVASTRSAYKKMFQKEVSLVVTKERYQTF